MLYASVVAFSIYTWEPDSYNFAYPEMEIIINDNLFDINDMPIDEVYDQLNVEITTVYNSQGSEITEFIDEDGSAIKDTYDINGIKITNFYQQDTMILQDVYDEDGETYSNFFYYEGTLAIEQQEVKPADYGDFLYYTVVTISTLGYGDITPSLSYNIAQAWGGFLSMYGLTFFALSIGFVSNIAMEGVTARREEDQDD